MWKQTIFVSYIDGVMKAQGPSFLPFLSQQQVVGSKWKFQVWHDENPVALLALLTIPEFQLVSYKSEKQDCC